MITGASQPSPQVGGILRPPSTSRSDIAMDPVETERFLSGFDTVECCFPDTWGIFVGRRMPAPVFLEAVTGGLSKPNAPFEWDPPGEIDPRPYPNPHTGFPNKLVVPALLTLLPA